MSNDSAGITSPDSLKSILAIAGAGAAGLITGGVVGAAFGKSRSRSHKRKAKRATRSSRRHHSISHSKRSSRRRYTPHTAGKRKDTSRRRIRYTKRGQPYVILRSGKARFIKAKSARSSHKRKGGRY